MAKPHRVLMSGHARKARSGFYQDMTPPEFSLLWMEDLGDPEAATKALLDVEFWYGAAPTAGWLERMPGLKLIQLSGVGYDDATIQMARDRQLPIAIMPAGTCLGVAEHTLLLILALYKHLQEAHSAMREGRWMHADLRARSYFVHDKVLGIVGLGRIGAEVARRARGFQPRRVVYHDLFHKPALEAELGVEFLDLNKLLQVSDIVTLHVFLGDKSEGMIGERERGLMKPSAILINTSRGPVVDEGALYRALRERRIWGAGLDVWEQEPTPADNPILQLDNVVCTPHAATATVDADRVKFEAALSNFDRVLRGKRLLYEVTRLYAEIEAESEQQPEPGKK
jgi:glyoxylate reductase/D-3-phosphoglycerate dehydrogenase